MTQSGAGSVMQLEETFSVLAKTLRASFDGTVQGKQSYTIPHTVSHARSFFYYYSLGVYGYVSEVPSFGDPWGFHMCWNGTVPTLLTPSTDIDEIDARIQQRLGDKAASLKYYDGITHRHIFHLSKPLRACIEKEQRIFTESNPIYMF